jgi:hypothetical protein
LLAKGVSEADMSAKPPASAANAKHGGDHKHGRGGAGLGGLSVDVADKEESWKLGRLTIDEVSNILYSTSHVTGLFIGQVRAKVKRRLGFDPFELSRIDKRTRYGMIFPGCYCSGTCADVC